jgi:hypothetical protein
LAQNLVFFWRKQLAPLVVRSFDFFAHLSKISKRVPTVNREL